MSHSHYAVLEVLSVISKFKILCIISKFKIMKTYRVTPYHYTVLEALGAMNTVTIVTT